MNNEQLKAERIRLDLNQQEMADRLGTPVSTYRKWEQGHRKVPGRVDAQLVPAQTIIPGLSISEITELDKLAREKGTTIETLVAEFIRSGLQKGS